MQTGASAGRLLYIYLNGKPLLISDETAQWANTSFTICTDHFRMHQSFQMVWETFKVGKQPCQPCCHHQDGCVTLPASSPSRTCHVLCSNSLGAPELWDSSVIWWLPLQNISTFFSAASSDMQLSSHEEEDGACTQGQRTEEGKASGPPSFGGDELLDQLLCNTYH